IMNLVPVAEQEIAGSVETKGPKKNSQGETGKLILVQSQADDKRDYRQGRHARQTENAAHDDKANRRTEKEGQVIELLAHGEFLVRAASYRPEGDGNFAEEI